MGGDGARGAGGLPGKSALSLLGFAADKLAAPHALRRGWIGLTMKPLIGYGSDVSASRPARLVGDTICTWTYSRRLTEVPVTGTWPVITRVESQMGWRHVRKLA
jgi:hypothetical protein